MAMKAVLETLEGLSEDLKKKYTQKDGKFYLEVIEVDGFDLQDFTGLKKALGTERGLVSDLKKQLKNFDGLDAEKARDAIDAIEALDSGKGTTEDVEAKLNSLREQLKKSYSKELAAKDVEITYLQDSIERTVVESALLMELSKAKAKDAGILLPQARQNVRVKRVEREENGRKFLDFVPEVVDATGNPLIGGSAGQPMTLEEHVSSIKKTDRFAPFFEGENSTGSGATGGSGGGGTGDPNKIDPKLTGTEKLKAFRRATPKA